MAGILTERRLTITQAARLAGVSPGCCWRWVLYGIRGGTVRLESALIGGRRYTSVEALERYIAACTAASGGTPQSEVRTSATRQRAIEAAERELEAAGL